ncbi:hypothetical protein [Pseudomonas sp. CCOS 191]|uniref:hypothetical protein n=1 Tax=Pseudomonas sp. CCOS 191 TaxID=1649877 RepID=UPI00062BCB55|nr:hypothetical protein [Pseudomonas sp. CCOS 191]
MQNLPPHDERRLTFEARRLTIEILVKVYLEQVAASRDRATIYLRLMFTLSLGALAGAITLYATMLRLSPMEIFNLITAQAAIVAISALGTLMASALLSARALQQSVLDAAPLLHNPFPSADTIIDDIFNDEGLNEKQILGKLYFTISKHIEDQPALRVQARTITALLTAGLLLTGLSFLM